MDHHANTHIHKNEIIMKIRFIILLTLTDFIRSSMNPIFRCEFSLDAMVTPNMYIHRERNRAISSQEELSNFMVVRINIARLINPTMNRRIRMALISSRKPKYLTNDEEKDGFFDSFSIKHQNLFTKGG